jgi:glycosyltransferase involved in cell wall biosynthesis
MSVHGVSVIVTVLNEGNSIHKLLDSLVAQTRQPDEVVIVDGGSTDDTLERIAAYEYRLPLRVLVEPGANISQGRNRAVEESSHELIASTDAGVRLDPRWLEKLMEPFVTSDVSVVAGFFLPDPQSLFEVSMGATVLPLHDDIDPRTFLPSSRSAAFTKSAWRKAGGYPEWLDYCEDLIFDFRLRRCAGDFGWAPEAVAYFRPRPSLKAFFVQYYRYARGDGKADLWRMRHAVRYATYLVALPSILALGALTSPWWLLLLLLGCAAYCKRPYQRLLPMLKGKSLGEKMYAISLVPLIRLVGDVAKMVGYPVGLAWRWKNRHRTEVHWRSAPCRE